MSKTENTACRFRTSIGGQALIEGILMRGPKKQAIVVRKPDGELEIKEEDLTLVKDKYPILGVPLIRGVATFLGSMVKGMKALTYSAEFMPEEEQEEPSKFDKWVEEKFGGEAAEKIIIGVAVVLGIALAIGLFVLLPTLIAGLIPGVAGHTTLRSLIEGIFKLIIFFAYMWLATRMKEIKRVFSYHGAEHKTIFCYEKGLPLTVENVRPQSRFHPRCGTSFLLVVVILGVFLGFLIRVDNTILRMLLRLLLLPVVVGVAYELNRWVGRHDDALISRIVSWPGKQLQHLTTFEPDDSMIEVAIKALECVIPEEKGTDAW